MKYTEILAYIVLVLFVVSVVHGKLDTNGKNTLSTSEELVSPLGYYKLRLLNNCSI